MYNLIKKSMKKLTFIVAFTLMVNAAFSIGLLTNTNQSAQFIRMMSRNASLDVDAVYYNPAGLIKLDNGWHFSVNNQTIMQTKYIDSKFPLLNDGKYQGDVFAPIFPTAFAVYKKDKWAFSAGFGPNGGGGTATFDRGLPSFEIPISKLPAGLAGLALVHPSLAVSGYDVDLKFDGSSIFWGLQVGATYKINDIFSVYGGVRYMPAKNTYQGTIKNIQLKTTSGLQPAPAWLNQTSGVLSGYAAMAQAGADMPETLQPIVDGGGGSFTLGQLEGAGYIDATQRAGIEGGLKIMGLPQDQIDVMDLNTVQGAYVVASPTFQENANKLNATAGALSATAGQLGDKEVDVEQTGAGFTPILGLNISPNENLNIGLRYEHKTYLTLKNATKVDDLGLFPDGADVNSDVPGILGIGIGYTDNDWFEVQLSYNMSFDKGVDWGSNIRNGAQREIENNSYDIGLGAQYNITKKFSISAGGIYNKYGIADSYQSDFSWANSSVAIGGGIMWKITDQLTLDAGVTNVFYQDSEVTFVDPDLQTPYKETYGKETLTFAVGLSYSIFR